MSEAEEQYSIDDLLADVQPSSTAPTSSGSSSAHSYHIGDRVMVLGGDRPYAAVITGMLSDDQVQLKYYEFQAEVALSKDNIAPIAASFAGSLTPSELTVGTEVECRYALDQQYYHATISGITQYGYMVTYQEYGNSEEVPIEFLRVKMQLSKHSNTTVAGAQAGSSSSSSGGVGSNYPKKNETSESKIIPIPENLKILPTDTEEVRISSFLCMLLMVCDDDVYVCYVMIDRKRNENKRNLKPLKIIIV